MVRCVLAFRKWRRAAVPAAVLAGTTANRTRPSTPTTIMIANRFRNGWPFCNAAATRATPTASTTSRIPAARLHLEVRSGSSTSHVPPAHPECGPAGRSAANLISPRWPWRRTPLPAKSPAAALTGESAADRARRRSCQVPPNQPAPAPAARPEPRSMPGSEIRPGSRCVPNPAPFRTDCRTNLWSPSAEFPARR